MSFFTFIGGIFTIGVLLVNAIAILNEERFLVPGARSSFPVQASALPLLTPSYPNQSAGLPRAAIKCTVKPSANHKKSQSRRVSFI